AAPQWPLIAVALFCLQLGVNGLPVKQQQPDKRLILPLVLFWPQTAVNVNVGDSNLADAVNRRTQADAGITQKQTEQADEVPQNPLIQAALIREQFVRNFLQSVAANNPAAIPPVALTNLVMQHNAVRTTIPPRIPRPVSVQESDIIDDNDEEYDYIDFKSGSRIKYDLDKERPPLDYADYPNPILQF
ncbi:hypothetical protein KR093_006363, partial [Drosophila rubida]